MAKPQLFLLHFAGGNSYSYKEISGLLKDFDTISLELPGRGRRIDEPLLKDFDHAAIDFYNQIVNRLNSNDFAIYGHSMGAVLAFKVSEMLENIGRAPVCLFVSGNPGPGIKENKKRYLMTHDNFLKELKSLGGLPDFLLDNKELFDFFEPILRADFEIVEKKDTCGGIVISSPIFAMMGTDEEYAESISNWSYFTNTSFNYEVLKGDHFFIIQHPKRVAEIIKHNFDVHAFEHQTAQWSAG